ncbi:hypothetical protein [Kineococcus aurantiacus]|uniref:Uncharacterized protein n=1 Tax=Kineococcus aurantiacus TaxID=37633 RepID=A0A7Y9DQM0_9ACTN|nr:hypothetical protein [Kineococcus aurantiacus]NYD25015.1 hypothetical protein [Kineococcus aurantiacus]
MIIQLLSLFEQERIQLIDGQFRAWPEGQQEAADTPTRQLSTILARERSVPLAPDPIDGQESGQLLTYLRLQVRVID